LRDRRTAIGANCITFMMQTAFIASRLPSLNQIIDAAKVRNGRWSRYAELKQVYQSVCQLDLKRAKLKPILGPVSLTFIWMEPNQKQDPDNLICGQKFVIDALVALKILRNDGWKDIRSITHEWAVDKDRPGVRIVIDG
jgi:Holliday junction resolvase RusA-like endonuclease